MINTKKTVIVALLILTLATAGLFASGAVESSGGDVKVVKASDAPADYSSLDLEKASFAEIMDSFNAAVENYTTKAEAIKEKMVKSYDEGNVDDYFDAKGMLKNLAVPAITQEQTEVLVKRISSSTDDAKAVEFAAWLYRNSQFYRPQITLTKDYKEDMGFLSFFNYKYVICTEPGSTVTLPSMDVNITSEGVFAGWGLTEDEVTYEAGAEITMPYSDLTLYPVFRSGVLFTDSVTGTEVFEEGDSINAPVLEAPDETYVFTGWYDENGEKADGSKTLGEGESAVYYAGWKSVLISGVRCTQGRKSSEISFSLMNQGTQNTGSLTIELVPEDSNVLTVKSGAVTTRGIRVSQWKNRSFDVKVSGNSGDVVKATIVVTDSDGNTWKAPVEFTVK